MRCPECYSDNPRITPLLEPEHCLKNHLQYYCSTCGRCICVDTAGLNNARCFLPFSSLESAMLYVKSAEILTKDVCGVFELEDSKTKKRSYHIFSKKKDLLDYLKKNPTKICKNMEAKYCSKKYQPVKFDQIKRLNQEDVRIYLQEQKRLSRSTKV